MTDRLNWRWEHETQTSMNFTNLVVVFFFYCQITLIHRVTVDYITAHSNFMCWTHTFSTYCITPEKIPSEHTVNLLFLPCLRHLPALLKMNNMLKTTEQILYFFVISKLYFFSILYISTKPFIITFVCSSTYTQNYSIAFECDVHCSFLQ